MDRFRPYVRASVRRLSMVRSHFSYTRELLPAVSPFSADTFLLSQPGLSVLPREAHIEAEVS